MSTKEFKWDMEIPIDLTLHGEVTEKGLRFKTRYYGMKRGEFLILHMPGAPQIREHLFKRENLIMRFMHAGTVYGFMTQVLAHSLLPAPIFFVKFPKYLETINLRKHQRVDTFLKARMQVGQEIQKGVILDISATGCRFSIDKGKNSSWSPLEPKTPIRLEFRLADNSDPIRMPALVASCSLDQASATFGVSFVPGNKHLVEQRLIDEYVQSVLEFSQKGT